MLLLLAVDGSAQESPRATTTPTPAVSVSSHSLMPVPASVNIMRGRMKVESTFTAAIQGYSDERLRAGLTRALRRLESRTGLEFGREPASVPGAANLVLQCQGAGRAVASLEEDESYTLEVSERQVVVNAPTVVGALRGLETFLQLLGGDASGYYIPEARIRDKPRFPWRGLLIDVGRHWQPIEVIKRNLDGMAAVKLNVLHLHLTEDQGFRIETKTFPKLYQSGSDNLYYTQDEVREIIAYARERGIRVVPEFDIPGHTTAWFVGHPELASAPGPYQIERRYGVHDAAMDPTREETYKFLDRFLGEMAALFPDAYMHIGGDEVTGKHWRLNPQIQAFIAKNNLRDKHGLQAYFNGRIARILQKHGKRMVGWDEMLHPDLPRDTVIQSWRGQQSLADGARQGYAGILSNGYYLDYLDPAAQHYLVDPVGADSGLTGAESARVLGGEACMWSEYVSMENIDSRIWPRLAAIAERLWSPREVRDVEDMYRRLDTITVQLEEVGLTHRTYEGRMLRRLAGSEQIEPLKVLFDVLAPSVKRGEVRPITQMTPLTRLVDAAAPDARTAREFARATDALLDDAPRFESRRERVRGLLEEWRAAYASLRVMADRSPLMREAEPLAGELSEMSGAGLEALQYLSANVTPPVLWREEKLLLLDRVSKTPREINFAILPSLRRLVFAAAELPQLKTRTAADWKANVLKLADEKK
ncbi:MAG TPA: family 20 glycosylhydrolase [Pyrinomonadaceae bacterium]|jgi:hexosaminidase|nr:family 20 glycosylhydrolase [Pyrinomonadaceae bacterium]